MSEKGLGLRRGTAIKARPGWVSVTVCHGYSDKRGKWHPATKRQYKSRLAKLAGKKLVVYKKAILGTIDPKCWRGLSETRYCIVELEISARAARTQPCNHKCRASSAKVLGFTTLDGTPIIPKADERVQSKFSIDFHYRLGEKVKPFGRYDRRHWRECASGIHFFLTRDEAVRYQL